MLTPVPESASGWPRLRLLLVTVGVGTLLLGACTSGDDNVVSSVADDLIVAAEPTTSAFDPSNPADLAGVSTSPSEIEAGQCFNEYVFRDRADFLQQVTTVVGCDGPHDREAYFSIDYPASETEAYPLDDTMKRWADSACLDEFEAFVGLEYVLSELEIGAIFPTFDTWTDEGDRKVVCFVYPDEVDLRLRASVANSGI